MNRKKATKNKSPVYISLSLYVYTDIPVYIFEKQEHKQAKHNLNRHKINVKVYTTLINALLEVKCAECTVLTMVARLCADSKCGCRYLLKSLLAVFL